MQPPPDTKDWTWTLTRRCDQCGLSAGEIKPEDFAERAFIAGRSGCRSCARARRSRPGPVPDVWSPLEYGAHVRDVYRLFDARLAQMLNEDSPTFTNWNQDETAIKERYGEQDPEVVADELEAAAQRFVARIQSLKPDQYSRRGHQVRRRGVHGRDVHPVLPARCDPPSVGRHRPAGRGRLACLGVINPCDAHPALSQIRRAALGRLGNASQDHLALSAPHPSPDAWPTERHGACRYRR